MSSLRDAPRVKRCALLVHAALLSARPELKGRPDQVKKYLCDNATPLGRHEFFEGAGLLDLMRVFSNA